ncbi:MAG: hypothetical protein IJ424_00300 [Oscillospiraceae bacterium]|nr:hypothetical protein [Oscillospiraceae bacterium]
MMFYVIGSEDQSRVLLHTAPANRTKDVVEQFSTFRSTESVSGRPDISQYGRTVYSVVYVAANRCAIIIRVMCYAVKVASPLTIFGISKGKFQRLQKISLYLLGHFQEKYQRAKNNSVQPGQNFQNPLPTKLVGSLNPHFCSSWTEVEKLTSTQVVSKSKITSMQLAGRLDCNFYPDCVEVNGVAKETATNFYG